MFKENSNHITQMNPKYNIHVEIINTIDITNSHKTPTIKTKWCVETTPYTQTSYIYSIEYPYKTYTNMKQT